LNIEKLFTENKKIIKASEIMKAGFNRSQIQKFKNQGILESVNYGFYKLKEVSIDDVEVINAIIPEAIVCMDSALFHYSYIDRTPIEWHLAVYKDISKSKFKSFYPPIKPYYLEKNFLEIGKTTDVVEGHIMPIYDRERVICACFRYRNKIDAEIFTKAINGYVKDDKKNIANLIAYSKELRVYKSVISVMEVLINA